MVERTIRRFSSILSRVKTAEPAFDLAMGLVIGCLGGFGAVGFRYLIDFFQLIFWGQDGTVLSRIQEAGWGHILTVPVVGGALVGPLVYFLAREAKGHGVPEVMEAVALKGGIIRKRLVVVKSLASALSIGSGGSVGREGPIVHIGSAIGSAVGQVTGVTARHMRTFVGCGAAAGIAATFNTPIAGAIFANEVILGEFGIASFSPIVVASVAATVISRLFLGNYPAFTVPEYELASNWEFLGYAVLGLCAAPVAVSFIRMLYFSEDFFARLKFPEYAKPMLGGALIGLTAIFLPQVMGVGYDTIQPALNGRLAWSLLLVLLFSKMLATSITLGSGGSGGIFAPSLFLGSALGGVIGWLFHWLFPGSTAGPGAYSLVGMGSLVAGTTHAPITAMLIIFEMTSDYKIILPLMISCVIASKLSSWLCPESIYTMKLARRGVSLSGGREVNIMRSLRVADVMQENPKCFREDTPLDEMLPEMIASEQFQFPILDKSGRFLGVVSLSDVRSVLFEEPFVKRLFVAMDILDVNYPTVTSDDNLLEAVKKFDSLSKNQIPVVSPRDRGVLLGMISRQDVFTAYNKEVVRRETVRELATEINRASREGASAEVAGYVIAEVTAPRSFVGRSIRDIDIRNRYNCVVLSVKEGRGSGEAQRDEARISLVPSPDTVIAPGAILVVMGPRKAVEELKRLEREGR